MKNIEVIGARENNLKNINVNIPKNKITVVTGVSGSGKSSLVFNTIYAESERLLLESMPFTLNNITTIKKPDVYKIKNLLPAIAISQNNTNNNPRSTVGTYTGISKYIRLLFSKIATINSHCSWYEGDFSYNNPKYWCEQCKGLGEEYVIDKSKIIDYKKSILDGGISYWWDTNKEYYLKLINQVSRSYNINLDTPIYLLDSKILDFILYGESKEIYNIRYKNYQNKYRTKKVRFVGVYKELYTKLDDIEKKSTSKSLNKYLKKIPCSHCGGARLRQDVLKYKILGKNIYDLLSMNLSELKIWLLKNNIVCDKTINSVYYQIIPEIISKIENLEKVKLGYISLNRSIPSLSCGELQRLKLANQISSELSGVLYVLDEPTKGLHNNDIKNICNLLLELKKRGNTLLIVEHNPEVILLADKIIDIGPKGGIYGGNLIFSGTPKSLLKSENLTSKYLKTYKNYIIKNKSKYIEKYIEIKGATYNNILNENFKFPLNQLIVVTGVSGSGKSTLVNFILEPSLRENKNINCDSIKGSNYIKKIVKVDQRPIGKSPKSNVATYVGLFDLIRELFASTPEARSNNLTKSHFSFNIDGGRCPNCKGDGKIKIDMSFMPNTYIDCEMCHGKRYKENILKIKYKQKNINDILQMTVIQAYEFFYNEDKITKILKCLIDVGLDYIKVGQLASDISGGEAQRIKLAKYLSNELLSNNMYILDEPTSGLHCDDIHKLLVLMKRIVNKGNTIIVIEHNIDIIKNADYIIDLGNQGGLMGGKIVDQGSLLEIKERNLASICTFI